MPPLGDAQQKRHKRGLPIVRVHHICTTPARLLASLQSQRFHYRLGEKDKPLCVVLVIAALRRAIRKTPVKKLIPAHEVNRKPLPRTKTAHFARKKLFAQLDLQLVPPLRFHGIRMLTHRPISGQKHRDLVPLVRQCRAECRHRISQPTRFDVRKQLTGHMHDFHRA